MPYLHFCKVNTSRFYVGMCCVQAVSDGSVVYPAFEAVRRAGRKTTWLYHFDYLGSNTFGPSALDGRIGKEHFLSFSCTSSGFFVGNVSLVFKALNTLRHTRLYGMERMVRIE